MRTTLALDDDVVSTLREHAEHLGVSPGAAASDLIRRGAHFEAKTRKVNGLPVFEVPEGFPVLTEKLVRRILEED